MNHKYLLKFCLFSFICTLLACIAPFQTKYQVTDKKECNEFINFLKTEFYRDKKGILRTTKQCSWNYKLKTNTFDTIINKPFFDILNKYHNKVGCYQLLKITDFYATIGKPDFDGIHPLMKYHYAVYFITDYKNSTCPCGKMYGNGFFMYKFKMGYQVAYYCHILEIRYRLEDKTVFAIDIY